MHTNYLLICVSTSRGLQAYTARLASALEAIDGLTLRLCAQKETQQLAGVAQDNYVRLTPKRHSPSNALRLLKAVLRADIDAVHYQGVNFFSLILLAIIAKFSKKTFILTPHNVETHFPNKAYNRFKWRIWNSFDVILLHTKSELRLVPTSLHKKVRIVAHGEYGHKISPAAVAPSLHKKIDEARPYLVFPGYIRNDKNLQLLIDNCDVIEASGYSLIVAGQNKSDIPNERIEQAAEFIDRFLTDDELAYLISMASFTILPYSRVSESGILHLSLSNGTPVICSNLESFRERIFHRENGIVMSSLDRTGLSAALETATALTFDTTRVREQHSSRYSWTRIASQTAALLK